MKPGREYLSYQFEDSENFVETFDELPLWSAAFGMLLLKHLDYRRGLKIVDIGSGAGFPLMEIASRFGGTCKCYGLDVWTNANTRARKKVERYGLHNVEIIEGSAEHMPFDDGSVDLIVSNLGVNNFENPMIVFGECNRVLKHGGKLVLTTNINGHWKEFYTVFEDTLQELGKYETLDKLKEEQAHRGTIDSMAELFEQAGLDDLRHDTEEFEMKFADGSAFLNHHFVKLGWLGSWMKLVEDDREEVFTQLEDNLNELAAKQGCLKLTVPMLYMEGVK